MMSCYYPTTTVAIDDDTDFLRVITQHLGIADCISCPSPSKAIDLLKNTDPFNRILSRITRTPKNIDDMNSTENYGFQINTHKLHEEIYSKERFNDVSVLIVDYHMDELNGFEVCETLINHPAKKILLTGGTDKEKVAIDAFNKGIIHRFINKSDPNFPAQLKQAVSLLKEAYFRDLTTKILPNISAENTSLLHNPIYINFTRNLQDQFNIVEHYLLDMTGSRIFFDINSKPLWFIIKHESEIDNFINIANDQEANTTLIKALSNREMFPFFFSDCDYDHAVSEWDEFLYPAYSIPGMKGYYYTIIEGHLRNNLNQEKIVSYAKQSEKIN